MAVSDTHAIGSERAINREWVQETSAPSGQTLTEAPWSAAHKIVFRFAFCYFVQYVLFDVPYFLGGLTRKFVWHDHPIVEIPWLKIVPWVGAHILGLHITGVGATLDSSYFWVKKFCFALFAAIITIVWSLLDKKRAEYSNLDTWLRVILRLILACTLFVYGGFKVAPSQMPPPSITRMIQPFGDASPFHLLWNFMGASTFYQVVCGAVEMTCSIFLLIPGMEMIGAALSLAALGQVILLNISYDVCVKLIPMHLALFAFYLFIPYIPRVMNFVFNRTVQPEPRKPLFRDRRWNYLAWGLQWAAGLYFAVGTLIAGTAGAKGYFGRANTIPLYGIWDVDEFVVDGQVHPPLLTDNSRWKRVVVDSEFRVVDKLIIGFEDMKGQWFPYFATVDQQNNTISLKVMNADEINLATEYVTSPLVSVTTPAPDPTTKYSLNYTHPQPDELILQGQLGGHQVQATLKKENRQFMLETHKKLFVHEKFPL
jgi:hypothetical protein